MSFVRHSAHGSRSTGRPTPSSGSTIHTTPSTTRYKLNAKLSKLDPTNTLVIHDWLIDLRAAAGTEFKVCFVPRADFESFYRLEENMPISEYSKADIAEAMSDWTQSVVEPLSKMLYGWIINHIEWRKDPELKRLIKGSDGTLGLCETESGRDLYLHLYARGTARQPHVQSRMEAEWAAVYAEAHSEARSRTIFSDVNTSDAVINQLSLLLETYEKIDAHRLAPPKVFIDTMLRLFAHEVPCLVDFFGFRLSLQLARYFPHCTFT